MQAFLSLSIQDCLLTSCYKAGTKAGIDSLFGNEKSGYGCKGALLLGFLRKDAQMLIDTTIRNAKTTDKPIKLNDGKGLYLVVRPNGSKLWRYRYKINDKMWLNAEFGGGTLSGAKFGITLRR